MFYKSRYKTLKIIFFLNCFHENLEQNPKSFFKVIFSMRFKESFVQTLIQKRFIFNYKINFRDKYKGLNAMNFNFLLTEHGLRNIDQILQLMNRYIQLIHKHINDQAIIRRSKFK